MLDRITMGLDAGGRKLPYLLALFLFATLIGNSSASLGDHLPEFKECVKVHTYRLEEQGLANEPIDRSVKLRIVKGGNSVIRMLTCFFYEFSCD